MSIEITHPFVSQKSDAGDASKVRPSNWNAPHTIRMSGGFVIGRTAEGDGAAEEVSWSALKDALGLGSGSNAEFARTVVGDGTAAAPSITNAGDTNTGIYFPAADEVAIAANGLQVAKFFTDPTGSAYLDLTPGPNGTVSMELGKGRTTNGFAYIDLVGDQTYADYGARLIRLDSGPNARTQLIHRGTGQFDFVAAEAATITFTTNNQERVHITPAGEVMIAGTTDRGAHNLQCNGTGVWGAGAYVNGSDARIKEDIAPISPCLGIVGQLNPVTFRYKEAWSKDRAVQPGFIAQELRQALEGEAYADGVVYSDSEFMSVAYQSLIPVLVKAIQELKAEFDAYRAAQGQ